jgi:nucleotidyltransferase-like protein
MGVVIDGFSQCLRNRLATAQLDYNDVTSKAVEVVIFGSRAAGVHRASSDLDVLLITRSKQHIKVAGLDCIILGPEEVTNSFWLGSELASHIAQYGCWIKGNLEWRHQVNISDRAIARKQRRVVSLMRNATQRWSRLHPVFHKRYAVTIRRELQRLDLLLNRVAIPPTPTLDKLWCKGGIPATRLAGLAPEDYRQWLTQLIGPADWALPSI